MRTLLSDNAAGAGELRAFLDGLRLDPAERARSNTNDVVLHELHGDPEHARNVLASMARWWRENIAVPALTEDAVVHQLVAGMRYCAVAAGDTICREGDQGSDFFVILAGGADVTVGGIVVGTLGAGDTFGEVALLENARLEREGARPGTLAAERKATVRAVSTRPKTELAVVTVALFNECLEKRMAQEQRLFKRMEGYEAATVQATSSGGGAPRAAGRLLQYAAAVHSAGRGRREQAEHALVLVERQQLQQEQRARDSGSFDERGSSETAELGAVLALQWERTRQDLKYARLATSRLGACLCAISRCASFLVRIDRMCFAARGRHVWRDRWLDSAKAVLPTLRLGTQSQPTSPKRLHHRQQPEQLETPSGNVGSSTDLGELELLRYSLMPVAESREWMRELQRADVLAQRAARDGWGELFSDVDTTDTDTGAHPDTDADRNAENSAARAETGTETASAPSLLSASPISPRQRYDSRSNRVRVNASAQSKRRVRESASRSSPHPHSNAAPSGPLDERRWEHRQERAQQRARRLLQRVRSALEQSAVTRAPSQRQALELLLRRHWLFDVRKAGDAHTHHCDNSCALRFSADEMKRLAAALELRRYTNGQQLFGSPATGNVGECDGLYFVLSGNGVVHGEFKDAANKARKTGKEKTNMKNEQYPGSCTHECVVKAGDSFGAVSLVTEDPHTLGMAAEAGLHTATKKRVTKAERVAAAAANVPAHLRAHLHTSVHDYGEAVHAVTEDASAASALIPSATVTQTGGDSQCEVGGSMGEEDALVCAVLPRTAFAPVAASRRTALLEQRTQCLAAARRLRIKVAPRDNRHQDQGEFDERAENESTHDVVWSRPRLLRLAYSARVRVLRESETWACSHDGSIGVVAHGTIKVLPTVAAAVEVEPTARPVPLVLKAGWHDAFETQKTQTVTALTACSIVLLSPRDVELRGSTFSQCLRNSLEMLHARITRQHTQLKLEARQPATGATPAALEAKVIAAEAAHRAALAFTSHTPDFRPSVPITSRLPHRVSPRAAAAWKRFGAVASETDATSVKVACSVPIVHQLNPPPPSGETPNSNSDVARANDIRRELLAHAAADAPAHTRQTLYFGNL